MSKSAQPQEGLPAIPPAVEVEIEQFAQKANIDLAADSICDSIQSLASTSATEIDRLIAELTQLRHRQQIDGERVHHEIVRVQNRIAGYTETNEAVVESVNGIGQTLEQFKRAAGLSQTK
jgi:hypothetical protein